MKTDRKVGEREGERHAVKVVVNGIRTRATLSGRSSYVACAWTSRPAGALLSFFFITTISSLCGSWNRLFFPTFNYLNPSDSILGWSGCTFGQNTVAYLLLSARIICVLGNSRYILKLERQTEMYFRRP